jgi:hypothetical protein
MSPAPQPNPNAAFYQKFLLPQEDKRLHPVCSPWDGGYRWFRSANVIDLQHYRSGAEKQRIRAALLGQKAYL